MGFAYNYPPPMKQTADENSSQGPEPVLSVLLSAHEFELGRLTEVFGRLAKRLTGVLRVAGPSEARQIKDPGNVSPIAHQLSLHNQRLGHLVDEVADLCDRLDC